MVWFRFDLLRFQERSIPATPSLSFAATVLLTAALESMKGWRMIGSVASSELSTSSCSARTYCVCFTVLYRVKQTAQRERSRSLPDLSSELAESGPRYYCLFVHCFDYFIDFVPGQYSGAVLEHLSVYHPRAVAFSFICPMVNILDIV